MDIQRSIDKSMFMLENYNHLFYGNQQFSKPQEGHREVKF